MIVIVIRQGKGVQIQWGQGEQGFLGDGAEAVFHGVVPAAAVGEAGQECGQFRQGVDMQAGLEAHTAGAGQFYIQDHCDGGETAGGDAAFEQVAPHRAQVG